AHERAVRRLHLGPEPELGRPAPVARILGRSTRLLDLALARKAGKERHRDDELRRERLLRELEGEDVVLAHDRLALLLGERVARKAVRLGHGWREPPQDLVRLLTALDLARHLPLRLLQQIATAARLARKARPARRQTQARQVLAPRHPQRRAARPLLGPERHELRMARLRTLDELRLRPARLEDRKPARQHQLPAAQRLEPELLQEPEPLGALLV